MTTVQAWWRRGWGWSLLVAALAFLILWPLVRLELPAFADGAAPIRDAVHLPGLARTLANTFVLAIGSVVIAVGLGTALAWCALRVPTRARGLLTVLPIIPLMVPGAASVTGWVFLLAPRTGLANQVLRSVGLGTGDSGPVDVYSFAGIVVITGFGLTSFVYLFVLASLKQRGNELEVAAAANGAGPWRVFRTITLPLLRPALVYSAGLTLLLGVGQFTAPLLLGTPGGIDVVTTRLFRMTQDYPVDYGAGAALNLPLVVAGFAVIVAQRGALRSERRFGTGGKARLVAGTTSWWATVPVLGYVVVSVVLPLGALTLASLSPFWSGSVEPSTWTLDAYRRVFDDPVTRQALGTSLVAALVTVVIVVPLGYAIGVSLLARTRVPGPLRFSVDVLTTLAMAMPGVLFGFAVLFTYSGAPFHLYGTTTIIVLAYVTLMIPHAVRPQQAAMISTSAEFAEASRVCGAGPVRTSLRVSLPLVRSGVAVSAALVVVLVFHEFAATLMVRSPTTQLIGTRLYDLFSNGFFPDAAVLSLVMVVATAVSVAVAMLVGGTKALENI